MTGNDPAGSFCNSTYGQARALYSASGSSMEPVPSLSYCILPGIYATSASIFGIAVWLFLNLEWL